MPRGRCAMPSDLNRLFADLLFPCGHGPVSACRRCVAERDLRAYIARLESATPPAPPPETREAPCGREETDGGGTCDMRAGHKGRCGTRISPQGHRRWFAAASPADAKEGTP
jgi:hypothetical protein